MEKLIKWSQWGSAGMIRCGSQPLKTLMTWMRELGLDAKMCVMQQEKPHAVYGMVIHDETEKVTEVRFYVNTYVDDSELDRIVKAHPHNTIRIAHKYVTGKENRRGRPSRNSPAKHSGQRREKQK